MSFGELVAVFALCCLVFSLVFVLYQFNKAFK